MALRVQWTKRADKKFDKIIDYLLVEWNEKVAKSFVKNVYDLIEILAEYPEIGTLENEEKEIRGLTIVKQVNVFYKVKDDQLIVLNFFDNRKDPKEKRF
jgi:plasmid stabilization system protein ParE